jgi:cell division protein FtsL
MIQGNFLLNIIRWLYGIRQLSVATLLLLVLISSFGVTLSAHETRQMYHKLQEIGIDQDTLDSEYEKLLLEQSAWADYTRIDRISRTELSMRAPVSENMVIVKR